MHMKLPTLLSIGAFAIATTAGAAPPGQNGEERSMNTTASALRAEIESRYARLESSAQIKDSGIGPNDISDIVAKYIPAGTSFDAAEKLLETAGFQLSKRGKHPYLNDVFDVIATLEKPSATPLQKTSISIVLTPNDPNNYATVSRASGAIRRAII
jgi:hypothetical protein